MAHALQKNVGMERSRPHPLLLAAGAAALLFGLLGAVAVLSAPQEPAGGADTHVHAAASSEARS